jgi:hypothetical protein
VHILRATRLAEQPMEVSQSGEISPMTCRSPGSTDGGVKDTHHCRYVLRIRTP